MGKHGGEHSRLMRCIMAPYRWLCRARDMYVNGMNRYGGRVQCGTAMAMGYPAYADFSRSYSVQSSRTSSGDEDLRELIRAASVARGGERNSPAGASSEPAMPRSQSVAVGRIDEDRPCDFGMEDVSVGTDLLLPRSRSAAVGPRMRAARAFV